MDMTTTTEADMPDFIEQRLLGLTEAAATLPPSSATFDDGGSFRVEIPSVEGPAAMDAVVTEAERLDVPLHRVSQGSGITLLSDAEILEMAAVGAAKSIEVCLFVGPRAPWEGSASALTPDGKVFGWRHTSVRQLRYAYDDVVRAVELGIRSILIADEGLICLVDEARRARELPQDLILKGSALMGIANPVGAALLERAGLDTINVASDAPLGELAAFRAACRSALDLYVESPDGLGGFTRYHELAEIVRVAAPIHLKFGLRNAPSIYPSGRHLEGVAVTTGLERVRRAALGLERLAKTAPELKASPTGLPRPGVPVPR
jgi:hypothetical protein